MELYSRAQSMLWNSESEESISRKRVEEGISRETNRVKTSLKGDYSLTCLTTKSWEFGLVINIICIL